MIFVFGAALAFFFEFLLISKKNKSLADKILVLWMFFIGLHLAAYYLVHAKIVFDIPILFGISAPFPLLHGPFLFLYTLALTGRLSKWRLIMWLHFAPVILFYIYFYEYFIVFTDGERIDYISRLTAGESKSHFIFFPLFMVVSALTYHILTLLQFRIHSKYILNNLSYNDDKVNLNWLRYLIIGMSAIWLVVIISLTKIFNTEDDKIIYMTVTLFVIAIGYFGVKQGNIFTSPPIIPVNPSHTDNEKRYQKSGLKESSADKLEKKLKEIMEKEKLYLDESFSLPKLADIMDVSQNHLSQLINERFKQNFYDFVNAYRVEEFKRLAQDPKKKHLTLLSLAFDAGFNSKSSFNKYFKKMTGQTPSAYVKKIY